MGRGERRRRRRRELQERRLAEQRPPTAVSVVRAVTQTLMRSGPLPPPAEVEHYDRVLPGSAERIMSMAERQLAMAEGQMAHRHEIEKRVIRADIRLAHIGQVSAIVLGVGGLGVGGYAIVFLGAEIAGAAVFLGSVATLVGSVIFGRKKRDAELAQKQQQGGQGGQQRE